MRLLYSKIFIADPHTKFQFYLLSGFGDVTGEYAKRHNLQILRLLMRFVKEMHTFCPMFIRAFYLRLLIYKST
jgi:hypothetical protein